MDTAVSIDSIVDIAAAGAPNASEAPAGFAGSDHAPAGSSSVRRRFSTLQSSTRSRADSRDAVAGLSFSIHFHGGAAVHLVAADATTCATWVDGLSVLRPGGAIVSKDSLQYIDSLADVGTRIRLLDLQDDRDWRRGPTSAGSGGAGQVATPSPAT